MEKTEIKVIEMLRRIRDAHYEQLKRKTRPERMAFYRQKALAMNTKAKAISSKLQQIRPTP